MKFKIIDRPTKDEERKLQCCPYSLFSWFTPPPDSPEEILEGKNKKKKKSKARKKL